MQESMPDPLSDPGIGSLTAAVPLAETLRILSAEVKASLVAGLSHQEQAAVRHGLRTMITHLDGMLQGAPFPASRPEGAAAH